MDINRQNMNELFLGFQQIFKRGFEAADLEYRKFSTEVRSTTAVEVYPFLEQFGGMREWIGDRQLKNVSSQKKKVANRDFEDTVIVRKNDIEDDKYGLYSSLIQDLGTAANSIWGELAYQALLGGDVDTWADELPFFSATRKYGEDSTIDNLGTAALSMEAYGAARLKMLQYRGHTGRALMEQVSTLLDARAHALDKQDAPLLEAIFQAEHYIHLCRERRQEIEILNRWQSNRQDQDREGGDFT